MKTQSQKAAAFRALHERDGARSPASPSVLFSAPPGKCESTFTFAAEAVSFRDINAMFEA